MASLLSQADVARLLAEPSASVRAEVAHKLAQEIDNTTLTEAELQLANDIVRIMARDVEVAVRRALSENLRRVRHLPHDVALRLAKDVEAVASEGSEAAVAALMGNASARVEENALNTVITRFADNERVKASVVHRAELPASIAERLVVMVSERLQAYLVRHHELPVSLATDLVLQSRERATLHFSLGSTEQELERLVRQMHRNHRLTPLLVLRSLCLGDLPFFEMAMAVMAHIPVQNARLLIEDAGPNGLASLYEKAGMPPRLLPAVRVAVDVVRGTQFDGGERDHERFRSRVITRILTQFEDLPQEDLDYLLDKLSDVLVVSA